MADTYGVLPIDIAAELPFVFKTGDVTQADIPNRARVTEWISRADARAYLVAENIINAAPSLTDKAVPMAKEFIVQYVKAKVLAAIYAGNDPAAYATIVASAYGDAKNALQTLIDLGTQIEGAGGSSPRLAISLATVATSRDLLVEDIDLDPHFGPHPRT